MQKKVQDLVAWHPSHLYQCHVYHIITKLAQGCTVLELSHPSVLVAAELQATKEGPTLFAGTDCI